MREIVNSALYECSECKAIVVGRRRGASQPRRSRQPGFIQVITRNQGWVAGGFFSAHGHDCRFMAVGAHEGVSEQDCQRHPTSDGCRGKSALGGASHSPFWRAPASCTAGNLCVRREATGGWPCRIVSPAKPTPITASGWLLVIMAWIMIPKATGNSKYLAHNRNAANRKRQMVAVELRRCIKAETWERLA